MPRNIEIKARVDDLKTLAARTAAIATSGSTAIAQDDTFPRCEAGRLKLREFADGTGPRCPSTCCRPPMRRRPCVR
ncbi:hypothetical protein KGA65_04995 [Ideonella sp. B7]|uniref:hypothetical protein n=1 Tax=Ideonella benzenivorans TaxID=2831643 RepID=UPI001CECA863|nr:hypothetical protein [Ideonella benzenivorans]MCA6215899.1 hypothetical protein [Ideonella benzenivorans]